MKGRAFLPLFGMQLYYWDTFFTNKGLFLFGTSAATMGITLDPSEIVF